VKLKEWGAFLLLGTIWGTSFLWIKIAVEEIGPLTLVAFRVMFGLLGLLVVMAVQRKAFPRDRRTLGLYLLLSLFQTAIPFALISWGETEIASSLASILNGTLPLFTIVIAHFWLADEKITLTSIMGLIVGFAGVVTLVSRDIGPEGLTGSVLGQLAVVGASISYAIGATFTRKYLRGQQPVVQSTMTLLFANLLIWPAALIGESPFTLPTLPITWIALLWLGLLGSCTAYLLYFFLINTWGATRASVVTYIFPVVGLFLGLIFLQEDFDLLLGIGSLLIVAGVVVLNWKRRKQLIPAPVASAAEGE